MENASTWRQSTYLEVRTTDNKDMNLAFPFFNACVNLVIVLAFSVLVLCLCRCYKFNHHNLCNFVK